MKRHAIFVAILVAAAAAAVPARADYAVLRSGARLHITGYQRDGDRLRLTVAGGTVDIAASEVASIEPEENFAPNPPAAHRDAGPFGNLIHAAAEKHGVDEDVIQHVIAAESNFNPRAISRKQALGLMQLLPQTAARYSVANVFDPAQNIDAGTRYLKELLAQYGGNLRLALAAYNAGPQTVERYRGVPPFRETQRYVRRITADLAESKKTGASGEPSMAWFEEQLNPLAAIGAAVRGGAIGGPALGGAATSGAGVPVATGAKAVAAAGASSAPGLD
ncbi:MAG TPA: lytic transglycosylase domain-containing protein [Candidatus Acidoferrum sp.]|nr:lytic transglycosylase domain-containing protein [Candidatus Acidoferrum sp.]